MLSSVARVEVLELLVIHRIQGGIRLLSVEVSEGYRLKCIWSRHSSEVHLAFSGAFVCSTVGGQVHSSVVLASVGVSQVHSSVVHSSVVLASVGVGQVHSSVVHSSVVHSSVGLFCWWPIVFVCRAFVCRAVLLVANCIRLLCFGVTGRIASVVLLVATQNSERHSSVVLLGSAKAFV